MIKWADGEQGVRDARELKDATNFRLGLHRWYPIGPYGILHLHTEYEPAHHALLRKAVLRWFAEFSEGVYGWVPEPSILVVNAFTEAIEQWLKEPTRTAYLRPTETRWLP